MLSLTTPLGLKTTYGYNAVGRRTSVVGARGNVSGSLPADYTTTFEYDVSGNQIGVTNPLSQKTTVTYTRTGTVESVKDPKSNTTAFTYDLADRLKTVAAPLQGTTTYSYNPAGRLISRTDSKSHNTGYTYDLAGRLVRQTDPLGRFWTYEYDPNGNRTKTVNAIANAASNPGLGSTTITYDRLNRPTLKDFSDTTPDINYVYDSIGRIASMTDGAGTETYSYDNAGRVTGVLRGPSGFGYTYDNNSNVITRTYPDGITTTYTYDDNDRLLTATSGTATTNYTYDPASNPLTTSLPNGTKKAVTYDRADRISTLNHTLGAVTIAGYTYTRDANGQPTQIVASGTNIAGTRKFTYDAANRLTQTCYASVSNCPAAQQTTWTYDSVGNRTLENVGGVATTYIYDNADQIINTVTGTVTTPYGYDANGNQTTAGTRIATYNTAMQTVSIKDGANPTTTYTYDGNGNRRTTANATTITNYTWDTNTALPTLASETDAVGTLLRRYTFGLEPISITTPTTTSYYLTDELGSTTHLTSNTGATQWAYTYTPYGSTKTGVKVDPAAPNNPIKFTGQYEDPTGNYNLRARLYNPNLGSFTQTDPLEVSRGVAYPSAYVYANNNPLVFVDPSGLRADAPVPESFSGSFGSRPGWGKFAVRAFISTAKAGCFGHIDDDNCHKGDGRSFSSSATCEESRACAEIDFDKGTVSGSINLSCRPSRPSCKATDQKRNKVTVTDVGGEIRIRVSIVNPFAPEVGGARVPSIDASLFFKTTAGPQINAVGATPKNDSIETKFNGDAFPSWEVYGNRNGGSGAFDYSVMQIKERSQMLGLPVGLLPAWPNHKQQSVVPQVRR